VLNFVLDCSVTAAWCFEDEASGYADSVLETLDSTEAVVPQLWLLELGNVLVVAERQSRLKEKETVRFLSLIRSLPIEVVQWLNLDVAQSILDVARDHGLSMYDSNYLWISMEEGIPLATLDESLREACEDIGVTVFRP
jgi:predicted nucleic acid-binding protein